MADKSILDFGAEAEAEEAKAILSARRAFLRAMASSGYKNLCGDLAAKARMQLRQLLRIQHKAGGCETAARRLLSDAAAPEARKALRAPVSRVRVRGAKAFVVFRPPGGKLSYFLLAKEEGAWRSLSLSAGVQYP